MKPLQKRQKRGLKSSPEIVLARELSDEPDLLLNFWEERYESVYANLFDDVSEFGRYGIIAEYIQRICPNSSVLDIGCGTGVLSLFLSNETNYFGVDLCNSAIETAKKRFPARNFLCADVRYFNSNQNFETIVFNESLYYLDPSDAHTLLERIANWTVYPRLIITSFYSQDKEARESFDIFLKHVSVFDGVHIDKLNGLHSWTVVCGFLNI